MTRRSFLMWVAVLCVEIIAASKIGKAVTIETVPVGHPGKVGDTRFLNSEHPHGIGSVGYEFRIGTTEVTNAQYVEFLNAVASSDPLLLYDSQMGDTTWGGIVRDGVAGSYSYSVKPAAIGQGPGGSDYTYANKPVVYVGWFDAIRFANWLHNGQTSGDTESGAYTLLGGTELPSNSDNITRNAGARWWLPSEDEWYKAAYYRFDGPPGSYWNYPTSTNSTPNNNLPSLDSGNSANFFVANGDYTTGNFNYPFTNAGAYALSDSPQRTFDQGGNAWEWVETFYPIVANHHLMRGGSWIDYESAMRAGFSTHIASGLGGSFNDGFRVASIPEPSTLLLVALASLGLLWRRRAVSAPRPSRALVSVARDYRTLAVAAVLVGLQAFAARAEVGRQLFKLTAADAAAADNFGYAVALDGNLALIGSRLDDDAGNQSGSAYLYDIRNGQQVRKLAASDAAADRRFGVSVALTGNIALVGAALDNVGSIEPTQPGSAYLFNTDSGQQLFKLSPSDAAPGDRFGSAVAISGNVAIVGAHQNDDDGMNSGSAYLFDVTTGQQLRKLTASDAAIGASFGYAVAIHGNLALVGAFGHSTKAPVDGAAYLFDVVTGQELFKFTAADAEDFDRLGSSVALSGNTALVGAPTANFHTGAAYLYDVVTGQQLHKLTAADAARNEEFGTSVAIHGNQALVGAYKDGQLRGNAGAAYLFDVATGNQLDKLTASDGSTSDLFGYSVALGGDTALVGAYQDDDAGSGSGSAYLFSTVSEPSAVLLGALGALGLFWRRRHLRSNSILIATVFCTAHAGAAPGDIYNLGTLGGTTNVGSEGLAINSSGQVTGLSYVAGTNYHAFLYTGTPGTMADLGTLAAGYSRGLAINASGQVVGESSGRAFLYTGTPGSGGVMADLGTLGGSGSGGASGINASGQITGVSSTTGNIARHAFLYTGTPGSGGVMMDLGTLGGTDSEGAAINASGQVVGHSWLPGFTDYHAFLYTGIPGSGGSMSDLGTLGGNLSFALAINDLGQITGSSRTALGSLVEHAFLYTGTPGSGGVMKDLGTLGGTYSRGLAINSAGQIAGESNLSRSTTPHAFLYSGTPGAGGRMIDLDTWLNSANPVEGAKWTLYRAQGITDTGLIAGSADYNDGPGGLSDGLRAFLLDASGLVVPEPSSVSLLMLGALAGGNVLRRRRWRRAGRSSYIRPS